MTRFILPILAATAAILPAAEGHKGEHRQLGTLLGRHVVDAGHILEARALPESGLVLIRWGDLDNVITADVGKVSAFTWNGGASVSNGSLGFVRTVAFEDGQTKNGKARKLHDHITASNGSELAWAARTIGAWDGVVVSAHGAISVHAGPASLTVSVP